MNTLQRWWGRFDIFGVPIVITLFLLLGYQGGVYMTERKDRAAYSEQLESITKDHTFQVEELRAQIEKERSITQDKDKRLRNLQNRQLRAQEKQAEALNNAIKATESATKAIEKFKE